MTDNNLMLCPACAWCKYFTTMGCTATVCTGGTPR